MICIFFSFTSFLYTRGTKQSPFSFSSPPEQEKAKKVAIKLKSIVGTPLYNQRHVTCELSFLSCMTRKVNIVIFNKILRILARSPINP